MSEQLSQLRDLVHKMSDQEYSLSAGPAFQNAAVGGHVRHVLDHVAVIVDSGHTRGINYDSRARGTPIETSPSAACTELLRVIDALEYVDSLPCQQLEVCVLPAPGVSSVRVGSTIERELAFALSHTIHHCATIRAILFARGPVLNVVTTKNFGIAPSTIAAADVPQSRPEGGGSGVQCAH